MKNEGKHGNEWKRNLDNERCKQTNKYEFNLNT